MLTNNQIYTRIIVDTLHSLLKPLGYKKKGTNFVRDCGELLHIIGLQKSNMSDANFIRVTVNFGVKSKRIMEGDNDLRPSFSAWDCHWHERIGHYLPDHQDKWWPIGDETAARRAAEEIGNAVEQYVLPVLAEKMADNDLVTMWRQQNPDQMPWLLEWYIEIIEGVSDKEAVTQ